MTPTRTLFLAALLGACSLAPGPAAAQDRLITTPLGAGLGLAAGGYTSLAIVVAAARGGHYVLEVEDIFGWQTLPVLIGVPLGATLGYFDPDRLYRSAIGGTAGFAAGAGAGVLVGWLVWEDSEGRWAGGAIGAGAGLLLGAVAGMLWPAADDDGGGAAATVVPIAIRIPLR